MTHFCDFIVTESRLITQFDDENIFMKKEACTFFINIFLHTIYLPSYFMKFYSDIAVIIHGRRIFMAEKKLLSG